jgi:hypothetical protein
MNTPTASAPISFASFDAEVTGAEVLSYLPGWKPTFHMAWLCGEKVLPRIFPRPTMVTLWNQPGELPRADVASHMLWLAKMAGVGRGPIILAVVDALRLGVGAYGTRDAQIYLGALDLIEMHVHRPCAVQIGDLDSLVMPTNPRGASDLGTLRASIQDRSLLTLPCIEDIVLQAKYDAHADPASAVRQHIPWPEVAKRFHVHAPAWMKHRDALSAR